MLQPAVDLSPLHVLPSLDELRAAQRVIRAHFAETPQYRWPMLEQSVGGSCWVKHENHTPVGAFKVRGGLVFLDRLLRSGAPPLGLVSATRGNHGQSLAYAARRTGIPVAIVVPHGNSVEKNAAMRALGAELIERGDDFQASTEAAAELAVARGWLRVPSFHADLVAGVGTWALELLEAVPTLKRLYVPIGMGSGFCGAVAAKRALGHHVELVGVTSTGAPAYAQSLAAGQMRSHAVTTRLADGMACRTPDPQALAVMLAVTPRTIAVSDREVAEAMRLLFRTTHNVAEGAGAAGLAAMLADAERQSDARDESVAFVLCGGNVDTSVLADVLRGGGSRPNR